MGMVVQKTEYPVVKKFVGNQFQEKIIVGID